MATGKLLGAKTPLDFMLVSVEQAQANLEAATACWRELAALALSEQNTLCDAAQAQIDSGNQAVTDALGGMRSIVPGNLDQMFGMGHSAFDNAAKLYGQWADASGKALQGMQVELPDAAAQPGAKKPRAAAGRGNGQAHATA